MTVGRRSAAAIPGIPHWHTFCLMCSWLRDDSLTVSCIITEGTGGIEAGQPPVASGLLRLRPDNVGTGAIRGGSAVTIAHQHRSKKGLAHPPGDAEPSGAVEAQWYALYTHSHCEDLVHDQLEGKGFSVFLPKLEVFTERSGKRCRAQVPMFPSYLFLHHVMGKMSYIEVCKARGLVRILGERWDRLGVIPESEIEAVRKVLQAHLPVQPHPYLQKGQRVRIMQGPLIGTEGIFLQSKPNKGLIILSVELLQRSVAVEVDCSIVSVA